MTAVTGADGFCARCCSAHLPLQTIDPRSELIVLAQPTPLEAAHVPMDLIRLAQVILILRFRFVLKAALISSTFLRMKPSEEYWMVEE